LDPKTGNVYCDFPAAISSDIYRHILIEVIIDLLLLLKSLPDDIYTISLNPIIKEDQYKSDSLGNVLMRRIERPVRQGKVHPNWRGFIDMIVAVFFDELTANRDDFPVSLDPNIQVINDGLSPFVDKMETLNLLIEALEKEDQIEHLVGQLMGVRTAVGRMGLKIHSLENVIAERKKKTASVRFSRPDRNEHFSRHEIEKLLAILFSKRR
jgi:hypothetical protein